jgi:hypothetical protein
MRTRLLIVAALVLFQLWLAGGEVFIAARLPSATYAAIHDAPELALPLVGTIVGLAGLAMIVALWLGRLTPSRTTRLMTLAVAGLVLAELWSASGRDSSTVESRAAGAMLNVSARAHDASDRGALPTDPRLLLAAFDDQGPAPFFKAGTRLAWSLDVRSGCNGPALDDRGREPGTVIYCLSPNRDRAWLAVVSVDSLFGAPFVLTSDEPVLAMPATPDVERFDEGPPPEEPPDRP